MSNNIFGTDGIRGLADGFPLNDDGAKRIGMAVGKQLANEGDYIIVGRDPRESSDRIANKIIEGINAVGVNVISPGVLPTPGLAYLTMSTKENDQPKFKAGIMVTASHNPYQYNGVKIFDSTARKLSDEVEEVITNLINDGVEPIGAGNFSEDFELKQSYEDFLIDSAGPIKFGGIKIAIDTANGAASGIAEKVFSSLGANVTALFDSPNGININQNCGATDVNELEQTVTGGGYDLGIAFDGDADRVIMVDRLGREVKGDYILYIIAISEGLTGVVATVMSNIAFEQTLKKAGIDLIRTNVGDHNVLIGLERSGYKLGGEESGHIVLPDLLPTGDGMLAAVQVVRILTSASNAKRLDEWCDEITLVPQTLINLPVGDKSKLATPEIQDWILKQNDNFGDAGRVLIRPSGTEPVVRVMVEAEGSEERAKLIADELKVLLDA